MPARRRSRGAALGAALAVAVAALGVFAGPASASDAGTITHAAGATSATLTWDAADSGVSNPRLTIVRDGVDYAIHVVDMCDVGCILVAEKPGDVGQSMVKVADLDGDGEPEVLVDAFSGGAHCCLQTRLLSWNGTGYTPADVDWRDGSYTLRDADHDGDQELVGQDPQFWGAFTAFAASSAPPLVLEPKAGAFVTATKRYPALIRSDAKTQLKELRRLRKGDDVRGFLASYVADQYLLRKGATGRREIDRQRRAGRVSKGFKAYLLRRLKQFGI